MAAKKNEVKNEKVVPLNKCNFNGIRPALVVAHNSGNTKAINKDVCIGAGVDHRELVLWEAHCESLREVIKNYIDKKWKASSTVEEIEQEREKIFPKWKEILQHGEPESQSKELRVERYDVDSLIGFGETFVATANGTVPACCAEQTFRKYVESLLGCKMAKNEMMSDTDKEIIQEYYGILNSISGAKSNIDDKKKQIKTLNAIAAKTSADDFKKYIKAQVDSIKADIKTVQDNDAKRKARLAEIEDTAKSIIDAVAKIEQ